MKTIIMLMPYFGNWPEWFNLYLETCKQNTTINWLFFTDCPEPENKCLNVRYIRMSFEEFRKYAGEKLGFPLNMSHPYKICDLRVAFGVIFDEYIAGYDYWGFGDIDLLYGNIRKFLTDNILRYNVISFHSHSLSGSFSCFKNNLELKYMYRYLNNWQDKLSRDNWYDELDKLLGKILIKKEGSYFIESFNAPGANGIPWVDGPYIYPTEWYWSDGRLINNRDGGREFLYFHFMLWKGGKWGRLWRGGQWENLKKIVHFHYKEATDGW
ncbi:MAG: hypothetical protein NTW13_00420, partial [Candidatus Omnitrophica bacterium]|nr:hypothetical protein [Candidatus Omnitrophota bacterium]